MVMPNMKIVMYGIASKKNSIGYFLSMNYAVGIVPSFPPT